MTIDIRKVTVLGTGVLGSQIAFQTAFRGFEVTAYDIDDKALAAARERLDKLAAVYREQVPGGGDGKAEQTAASIALDSDLARAVQDADLVIEAIPEVLSIKQQTYEQLGRVAPERTIFATNSSTLLPSAMKDFTGRPDRFLALHFANQVWHFNTAEIMGTADTDPNVYQAVVDFASEIGMVPIEIHKEKAGYVLNSLLVPLLNAGMSLAAGGYADPEAVDKTLADRHRRPGRAVPHPRHHRTDHAVQHPRQQRGRGLPTAGPVVEGELHRQGQARHRHRRGLLQVLIRRGGNIRRHYALDRDDLEHAFQTPEIRAVAGVQR